MKVQQVMIPQKECVGPNDTTAAAAHLIDKSVGDSLPVLDHTAVAGTVESQQITGNVEKTGRKPEQVRVKEVMSENQNRAYEDEEAEEVWSRMKSAGLTVVPVLNREQKLVGMLKLQEGK